MQRGMCGMNIKNMVLLLSTAVNAMQWRVEDPYNFWHDFKAKRISIFTWKQHILVHDLLY